VEKVKLVFARSFVENPTVNDCFAEIVEIKLPSHIKQAHLIAARCYQPDAEAEAHALGVDTTAVIWDYQDEQRIVGKLLTYIDATYSDKEQRQAHKDILKDVFYGYCQDLRTRAVQTVDAYPDK